MITAFILGFMGSLHCAGMCGPLVLLTPVMGSSRQSILASRLLYHLGRLTTYMTIGLLFGLVGESIIFAGLQRWLSIIAGVLMLVAMLAVALFKSQTTRAPFAIKSIFGRFLHKRTVAAIFALGATNGLLPCGLVYMAATASIASGSVANSILYMALFGLGTLPMLLGISFAAARWTRSKFPALQKLAPIAVACIALLLIWRGNPISILRNDPAKASCPACNAIE